MARKRRGESRNAYFRRLFESNSGWLKGSDNSPVVAQWKLDHPGKEMKRPDKQSMANAKSFVRKQQLHGGKRGQRRLLARSLGHKGIISDLEKIEFLLDEALFQSRRIDEQGLASVISHIRNARKEVILKALG